MRAMKARAEAEVARRGTEERDLKRGLGGIRDVEFAVQLLQLVHGGEDATLREPRHARRPPRARRRRLRRRCRRPRPRRGLHASCAPSSTGCSSSTCDRPTSSPRDAVALERLARSLGDRGDARALRRRRAARRAAPPPSRRPRRPRAACGSARCSAPSPAANAALAAFGFADADRTQEAVAELTRGLTRTSRLMQQLLPLLLEWLSLSPDPDLGLLGLRRLAVRARAGDRTRRGVP